MKSTSIRQKDIADALNISVNTVSHALRDMDDVSFEMKEKIRNKAYELGYVPNTLAVKLKTGTSKTIAVVYDNLTNPYFTIMASKLFEGIKEKGYDTIIYPCKNFIVGKNDVSEILKLNVDGILSFLDFDKEVIVQERIKMLPVVLVGRLSDLDISSSYTDDYTGGALVARYFNKKGYRNILYITPKTSIENSSRRYNGLVSSFEGEKIISKAYNDEKEIEHILDNSLLENKIDAIFCFNDVLAMIAKRYLNKAKNNIIEVVGFDDLHRQLPFMEDITSVHYDFDEVAKNAINILLNKFENNESDLIKVQIPVTLHVKE